MTRSPAGAHLIGTAVPDEPSAVVLVLHGGPEHGTARCYWWHPQVLRCRELAGAVARRWRRSAEHAGRPAVYRLQHSWTGWDGDGRDVIADVVWALAILAGLHPERPVALLAHSMGARVACRVADAPGVQGVVGLAPWLPAADPMAAVAHSRISAVHGTRDREITPESTTEFLRRAGHAGAEVVRIPIRGGGHAMLFRMARWNRMATEQLVRMLS